MSQNKFTAKVRDALKAAITKGDLDEIQSILTTNNLEARKVRLDDNVHDHNLIFSSAELTKDDNK
jgi:hypothetical protein